MLTAAEVQDSFHYLYPAEVGALKMLTISLSEFPLVVNIGAGAGTSGLLFAETRPDLFLVTVDIQDESSPLGCLEAERDVIERAGLTNWRIGHHWQFCMDSALLGREWESRTRKVFGTHPNMVFIDGDHSYEHCKEDIEVWLPLVKSGGIIAVHDYRKEDLAPDPNGPHPMPWPGVNQAVDELLLPHYEKVMHVASLIAFRV